MDSFVYRDKRSGVTKVARSQLVARSKKLVARSKLANSRVRHAALHEQLKHIQEDHMSLDIVIRPSTVTKFVWYTLVEAATLVDLRTQIFAGEPEYARPELVEIFAYESPSDRRLVVDDRTLRTILRNIKNTSRRNLTLALETSKKAFSHWYYPEICNLYRLPPRPRLSLDIFPPFDEAESLEPDSFGPDFLQSIGVDCSDEFRTKVHDGLIEQLKKSICKSGDSAAACEARKLDVVGAFLDAAQLFFPTDIQVDMKVELKGRRGHGSMDFSIHSAKVYGYVIGVAEVKTSDLQYGMAQNAAEIESAVTSKAFVLTSTDGTDGVPLSSQYVEGDREHQQGMRKCYGIVTDSMTWIPSVITLFNDGDMSIRASTFKAKFVYNLNNLRESSGPVLWSLVWLFSLMRDEIPARDRTAGQVY